MLTLCASTCAWAQMPGGLAIPQAGGAVAQPAARPKTDTTLGFLHFKAPDGWTAIDQPDKDGRIFRSPDSSPGVTALILVYLTPPAKQGTDPFTALQQAINDGPFRGTISKTFREGAVDAQDDQGYDIQMRRMETDDGAGHHFTVAAYAVSVDGRLGVFWYGASTGPFFYAHFGVLKGMWATYAIGDGSPSPAAAILVPGDPPLTQRVVNRAAARLEGATGLRLTPRDREQFARYVADDWRRWDKNARVALMAALSNYVIAPTFLPMSRLNVRAVARAAVMLDLAARNNDPFAQSCLAAYAAAHDGAVGITQAPAGDDGPVLAAGEPPLMRGLADRASACNAWAFGLTFTPAQRKAFQDLLVERWNAKDARIGQSVGDANLWVGLSRLTDADRELIAVTNRPQYIAALRTLDGKIDKWLAEAYDAAHPTARQQLAAGAAGEPPLTREASDAYVEYACFQANQTGGTAAFTPTAELKDRFAGKLAADFAGFSPTYRQAVVNVPAGWAEVRVVWPLLDEPLRIAVRESWTVQPSMLAVEAPAGGRTQLVDAPTLLARFEQREMQLDVDQQLEWAAVRAIGQNAILQQMQQHDLLQRQMEFNRRRDEDRRQERAREDQIHEQQQREDRLREERRRQQQR